MKKIILIFLFLSFSITAYSWEKVPVQDYVDKKTKSPWNFFENFEDQKKGKLKLRKFSINDKGVGLKPFIIKEDNDGNKFLEVTVKHGWNTDKTKNKKSQTERAEFQTKQKRTLKKTVWIGFNMRLPENFMHLKDRVLFFQYKNQFDPMQKSPLLGLRFYDYGKRLSIGGNTGGIAAKSWNNKENKIHDVKINYSKIDKDNKWVMNNFKTRNSEYKSTLVCSIQKVKTAKIPDYCKDEMMDYNKINPNFSICYDVYTPLWCYGDDGKLISKSKMQELLIDKSTILKGAKNFKSTNLGEWSTYKIGIRNSKKEDGFVKVYKDDKLIFDYKGVTFNWKGKYTGTYIRIGVYRDSGIRTDEKFPDQSIHFDNLTVVSDKKSLDKYLN